MWRMHRGSAWAPGAASGGAAPKAPPTAWGGAPQPCHPCVCLSFPARSHSPAHPRTLLHTHPCTLSRTWARSHALHGLAQPRTPVHALAHPCTPSRTPHALAQPRVPLHAPCRAWLPPRVLARPSCSRPALRALRAVARSARPCTPFTLSTQLCSLLHALARSTCSRSPRALSPSPTLRCELPGGPPRSAALGPPSPGVRLQPRFCLGRVRPGMLRGAEH